MNWTVHCRFAAVVGGLVVIPLLAGCAQQPNLKDPDPALKIPAMKEAATEHDKSQLKELVNDLESDDAAVRFYAIETLHRLTGATEGYEYYADEASRAKAVARWRKWLAQQSTQAAKE